MAHVKQKQIDTPGNCSLIHKLSDDSLAHLFSYLSKDDKWNVEKVCKRWKKVSKKGWPDIKSYTFYCWFPPHQVKWVYARCGRFLTDVKIHPNNNKTIDHLSLIKKFCRLEQLQKLSIELPGGSSLSAREYAKSLGEMFEKCTKLKSVIIEGPFGFYKFEFLNKLSNTTLTTIKVEDTSSGRTGTNLSIRVPFKNLRELTYKSIHTYEGDLDCWVNFPYLEKLELTFCKFNCNYLEKLVLFKNLKELTVYHMVSSFRDSDMSFVARNCLGIKKLRLVQCCVTNCCFADIAQMPSLEDLHLEDLERVTDDGFERLVNVKTLTIKSMQSVEGDSLIQLIENSQRLETLNLYYGSFTPGLIVRVNEIFEFDERLLPLNLKLVGFVEIHEDEWVMPPDISPLLNVEMSCRRI